MRDSISDKLLNSSFLDRLKEHKPFYEVIPFDEYHLVMALTDFLSNNYSHTVTKTYFYRKPPFTSSYILANGITSLINTITNFKYADIIPYLERMNYDKSFIEFLKAKGSLKLEIHAMADNSVAFPLEPIVIIKSDVIDSRIIEGILLTELNFPSLIATKWHRIRTASGDRPVMEFGRRRAQSALKASLYSYIAGINSTSNCEASYCFGIPTAGTMGHEFIQTHNSEIDAFNNFIKYNPDTPILLVDTINTLGSGVINAIKTFKSNKEALIRAGSWKKIGIRIDSGDLAYLAAKCYEYMCRDLESEDINIVLSNDLDEYKIESINSQLYTANQHNVMKHISFGVGTRGATAWDEPALGGICKVSEVDDKYILKISNNISKITIPSDIRSSIILDKNGEYLTTLIYMQDEELDKIEICYHPDDASKYIELKNVKRLGVRQRKIYNSINNEDTIFKSEYDLSLNEIRRNPNEVLNILDWSNKRITNPHVAKVSLSKNLFNLRREMILNKDVTLNKDRYVKEK